MPPAKKLTRAEKKAALLQRAEALIIVDPILRTQN
jgi:hypothetical protein